MIPPRIVCLGAGRMGRGIALVFAYAGLAVTLLDAKARGAAEAVTLADQAQEELTAHLAALQSHGVLDAAQAAAVLGRIALAAYQDTRAALAGATLIFEGVPEVTAMKQETLALASRFAPPDCIIASTTSTISVDTLAEYVGRPARFLNAHWLNPAYIIPLVELSPSRHTAPEVVARLKSILAAVGKVPVVCAAAPGFIVPRIQALAMNEAARMVEQGLATAEDIDLATRYGLGFRFAAMGLTEFIDFGGGDTLAYASRYLTETLGDTRYAAPAIIERNMEDGRIGLKSGQGFHDWTGAAGQARRDDALGRLIGMLRHNHLLRPPGFAAPGDGETA